MFQISRNQEQECREDDRYLRIAGSKRKTDSSYCLIDKITYPKEGPDAVPLPNGYYIKSFDSIYIYNRSKIEVIIGDSSGHVKSRIPLWKGNSERPDPANALYYPQFVPKTVTPFIEYQGKLLLMGLSPFSLHDSLTRKFRFTACIDMESNDVTYKHPYPSELYGNNVNWGMEIPFYVYPLLMPDGQLISARKRVTGR
ncbi:MAG: DUF4221 domain-containing protein [Tannerella sp.]|nr:DUF4221 domain-containing protein [Tannerella sp.]